METLTRQCATEAAAFAWQSGMRTIDGNAVAAMHCYLQTCSALQAERFAGALSIAVDIFIAEIRKEAN